MQIRTSDACFERINACLYSGESVRVVMAVGPTLLDPTSTQRHHRIHGPSLSFSVPHSTHLTSSATSPSTEEVIDSIYILNCRDPTRLVLDRRFSPCCAMQCMDRLQFNHSMTSLGRRQGREATYIALEMNLQVSVGN
jgi:hypothetical protein